MYAVYSQESGTLWVCDRDALLLEASCYAGRGDGLNNPDAECIRGLGPLPRAVYRIGDPIQHPRLGPLAFPLTVRFGSLCGRDGFYIHGDNKKGDRSASSGCIIAPKSVRQKLKALRPLLLIVER